MVEVEIEVPDDLHRELQRIMKEYNLSISDLVKRGLEKMVIL